MPAGRRRRLCALVLALGALAACAKPPAAATPDASAHPVVPGRVGYVRMGDLMRHHPLYGQLAQYDDSIAALNLSATVPEVAKPDAAIRKEQIALQRELETAAARTKTLLDAKSKEYSQRESAAIAAALRANGSAPSAGAIADQINTTAAGQIAGVNAQAQRDVAGYRTALGGAERAQIAAAQRTLQERAARTYRAKQDELSAKESALTLDLANRDAAERLSLRTKLSSLAMEDGDRDAVRAQLAAIDRREADAIAPLKNRDQATLATLGAQLRAQVGRDIQARANGIHTQTLAKLRVREGEVRRQFGSGPVVATTVRNGRSAAAVNPNLPPQLRAKISALHNDYQRQFDADARSTIGDFNKTRADLSRRYAQLRAVDGAAQNGAQAQIASLTKKREDLYDEMFAQIGREVKLIAAQHGCSVVVTDPVANAGGVDLTADAMKDIESLHE